jgi:uncharacterized protein (DUF169 family)
MELGEMADIMKTTLQLKDEPVGVVLFKSNADIPQGLKEPEKPLPYCMMVQMARKGQTTFARPEKHECKGGASGIGLMECPQNIASGDLYFSKLDKCVTKEVGKSIVDSMPRPPAGSTLATLVGPLAQLQRNPDVVIFVGNALQARRIAQAMMYRKGGRLNFDTAGIQSFCVDATSSPYLRGEVNVSLGCDGSAKKTKLADDEVVVGIPFGILEDICKTLKEQTAGWDTWMRT